MTSSTRAQCPACYRSISLKKDRTLRAHGYQNNPNYSTGPGCPGSGKTAHCACVFGSRQRALEGKPNEIDPRCGVHNLQGTQ